MSTNGIFICGDFLGKDDNILGKPFAGPAGRLLTALLAQAGIDRDECYLTNVFSFRPQSGDIKTLCGPKAEGIADFPSIVSGKYVNKRYESELGRLFEEVQREKPNLILALGSAASWAFLRTSGIKAIRGAPAESWFEGYKVLPTYHPQNILRDFAMRPILYADLCKAKREAEYPEVRRPHRNIWIEPTLEDLTYFRTHFIHPSPYLSVDIETKGDTITCVGFAPTTDMALVVPFFDPTALGKNYWRTHAEELQAWSWVRETLALKKKFVFQNGLYDLHFLWRQMGLTVPHATHDTMLLHHALQPELQKGLGFLASIYCDEASWKMMRKNTSTVKRED